MTRISDVFKPIISSAVEEQKKESAWGRGAYAQIKSLEIDPRGEIGEMLVGKVLASMKVAYVRNNETDRTKKHWDIRDTTHDFDFEVKLATQGKTKTYQYEGFEKDRSYDGVILIGVAPNDLYLTCVAKHKMPFVEPNNYYTVTTKRMHRRGHGIQFKWTLSQKDVDGRKVETIKGFYAQYESMINDISHSKRRRRRR